MFFTLLAVTLVIALAVSFVVVRLFDRPTGAILKRIIAGRQGVSGSSGVSAAGVRAALAGAWIALVPISALGVGGAGPVNEMPGRFLAGIAVTMESAEEACPIPIDGAGSSARMLAWACSARGLRKLGALDGVSLLVGEYRCQGPAAEVAHGEQTVLYEESVGDQRLTAVWHDVTEVAAGQGGLTAMRVVRSGDAGFVELRYQTGGTGGFWTEYLTRRASGWSYLRPLPWQELERCLPAGYSYRKGIQIRLEDLTARAPIFLPEECNACASVRLGFRLSIEDQSLRVARCWREVVEAPDATVSRDRE